MRKRQIHTEGQSTNNWTVIEINKSYNAVFGIWAFYHKRHYQYIIGQTYSLGLRMVEEYQCLFPDFDDYIGTM